MLSCLLLLVALSKQLILLVPLLSFQVLDLLLELVDDHISVLQFRLDASSMLLTLFFVTFLTVKLLLGLLGLLDQHAVLFL